MKKVLKEKSGITLIALVITIIVLLILAGVSIAMLTGDNGILTRAIESKEQTEKAGEKEQIELAYMESKTSKLNTEVTSEELLKSLNNNKITAESVYGNGKIGFVIVLENKNIYEIDVNGNLEYKGTKLILSNADTIMKERNIDEDTEFWKEEYRTKIIEIEFKPYVIELENVIKTWDISKGEGTKGVMAYLVDIGSNEYKLYIMANGIIEFSSDCSNLFSGFTNLRNIDILYINTENVTKMTSMFKDCESLEILDINNFNTKQVTTMSNMFFNCKKLKVLELENFDTSNTISMNCMFYGCNSLIDLNLKNFNTSKVTNMTSIFQNCSSLRNLDLNNFDTSKLERMYCMFYNCSSLEYLKISSFNTAKVTDMRGMFANCKALKNLDLSSFDTSRVIQMSNMFANCNSIEKLNLSNLSNISTTECYQMFFQCTKLKELDISGFTNFSIKNTSEILTGLPYNSIVFVKNQDMKKWLENIKNVNSKIQIKNAL